MCGAYTLNPKKKVLREVQFIYPIQHSPIEILNSLRDKQKKIEIENIEYKDLRQDIVEWVIDMCDHFKLRKLTAYISVYTMDLVHSASAVPKALYKPVAAVCILISNKSEESSSIIDVAELSEMVKADVRSLELKVLSTIGWKLQVSTSLHFLECYFGLGIVFDDEFQDIRPVRLVREYSELLLELCLAEYSFYNFLPDQLACACIGVARKLIGLTRVWTKDLTAITSQDLNQTIYEKVYEFYLASFKNQYI